MRTFLLLLIVLLAAGCREVMGPTAVPDVYSVVPVEVVDEVDLSSRLKDLQNAPVPPYQICPQDKFNVTVYEHNELNVEGIVVTPDGYLSLPLIGPVKVGGLTLVEATDLVRKKFAAFIKSPLVSLIPTFVLGYNFTILGSVNNPGRYPVSGDIRVMDAVALARGSRQGLFNGDTTDTADYDNAYIARNGEILPVNFRKAIVEGNALHNIPLRNGDYIYIPPETSTAVYVLGEVSQPTYVGYKEGMTLLKSLAFARGLLDSHNRYANVIRGGLKSPKLYKIDLVRLTSGEAMDFKLEPNDIVFVPKSDLGDWNVIVREIIPSLQGLSMMAGPFGNPSSFYNND